MKKKDLGLFFKSSISIRDISRKSLLVTGFSKKTLSKIFGISRPTFDKYLNDRGGTNFTEKAKKRYDDIYPAIEAIEKVFDHIPGASGDTYLYNGVSLVDLLSRDDINVDEIVDMAFQLNKHLRKITSQTSRNTKLNALYNN